MQMNQIRCQSNEIAPNGRELSGTPDERRKLLTLAREEWGAAAKRCPLPLLGGAQRRL
jgi:hypothetical protein